MSLRTVVLSRPVQWACTAIIVAYALFFVLGCAAPAEPVSMQKVEVFQGALKKAWVGAASLCDPAGDNDHPGKIPQVNACFTQLLTAFGVGGATIGKCAAAAAGSATVGAAIGAWSTCGLGVMASALAVASWLDATQLDGWANWSENELAERMRRVIFDRMVARGIWGRT